MLNKKIEYFVTLAECLSFTQAAAVHSVSQTAISQYIASLEGKLQVRLFNRNAHSVSLTDAGQFFYERVNFMLRYDKDTKKRLIAIAEQYRGHVKVGIGMYESRHTEDFFSRFLIAHPEIKVDIFQYPYGALTEKLKSGELDVILANVLCEHAFAKEDILSRPMFEAYNYLVADRAIAAKYPQGDAVSMLRGECLITNCEDTGPNSMDMLRQMLLREFGVVPERFAQTNSTNAQMLMVRARHEFEEFGKDRVRIVITEIPYQVNKRMLIKNMADQVEDKRLEGISDIRDESDRNGMRVVIELKRDANPQVVLNRLFAQTQLQTTFAINMLALVQSGGQPQPKILSLRHILDEYIAFQEEVIVRRTRYDLRKAQERAHLLEGLLIAEDNIDAVIQTIRESYDDAKENLMNRFGLSDVQAQAILDMQLKRLQGLEKEKLQNEYKELEARIAYFNELLSSEEKIRGVLKDELTAIRDRYGDDRVTEIQDVEDEIDIEDLIEEEECVFTLTAGGYIKRTAASTYKAQRRGGKGITAMSTKEEDYVDTVFTASTHDFILFFTNKGRVHRKKGYQIPEAGRTARGTNLVNVLPIEQDEKVTAMIHLREFPEDRYLVMVTRSGTVKRIQLSSIYTARKAGIRCITLDEGDELICVRETDGDQAILIVTHDGMAICFKETDVRCMGRDAAGVRGINLRPGDYVVGAARAKRDHQVLMITENGYGKRTDMDEYIRADGPQKRGGFGLKGYNITEKTGPVVGVKVVSDGDDVLVINDAGVIIRMAAAGISTYGRTAQGVKIMNLEEGVKVISFARTDHEEEEEAAEGETPAGGPEQA